MRTTRQAPGRVVDDLIGAALPPETVDLVAEELRRRLDAPVAGATDGERQRLTTRIRKLAELYGWGDIEEADYRKRRREAESALAALPADDDKIVVFSRHRAEPSSRSGTSWPRWPPTTYRPWSPCSWSGWIPGTSTWSGSSRRIRRGRSSTRCRRGASENP
jgi:hypothetical protein